jgi:hypothetical protein
LPYSLWENKLNCVAIWVWHLALTYGTKGTK